MTEMQTFHAARRMKLMGAMGVTSSFDIAKAINIVIASLVTNYCEKQGVDAAKCDVFWQKATILEGSMNDAINAEDVVAIVIIIDQLNDFKKEVEKAIEAANAQPPPTCPYGGTYPNCNPAPSKGLSTGAIVGIGVGVVGVLGIILYAVIR